MSDIQNIKETLVTFFREHIILFVLAVCMVPLGAVSAMSLLIGIGSEVVYEERPIFTMCNLRGAPEGKDCVGSYELSIGNTGHNNESLKMLWPATVGNWSHSHQIMNIAADEPREKDPTFKCMKSEEAFECNLQEFTPGALVIIKMSCLGCSNKDMDIINGKTIKLETDADLYKGNPRVSVFWRRIHGFFGWFLVATTI